MIAALDALARLRDGNRRFVLDERHGGSRASPERRRELTEGQAPFAVVLGCSDSRVPADIVFDQGLGDLFVVRVAGNIAAPSQVGSIELAADLLGSRLVVVLGHTGCGAVAATLDALQHPTDRHSSDLWTILDRIRPAVAPLLATELRENRDALLRQAVRAHVSAVATHLRQQSPTLRRLAQEDGLLIVGAVYSLETGGVEFFDGLPETV